MIRLTILGVTHFSDFYPNVRHKVELIGTLPGIEPRLLLYDLGKGALYSGLEKGFWQKLGFLRRFLWGHFLVFLRFLWRRTGHVYICYPGVFLVMMLLLLPRQKRLVIYLDAFISLYDTVVNDRNLLPGQSPWANLLFRLERRAFKRADFVLTDTLENADYYAELFHLPRGKFVPIALSIPDLQAEAAPAAVPVTQEKRGKFTCLFVGSLVPLHGITAILEAAARLAHVPDLEFVIIGDGQEAFRIEAYQERGKAGNLVWHRGMFPLAFIAQAIREADLCLGIFGDSAKAGRVLPYKIYYYTALGKPFLSRKTPCLERCCEDREELFLCTLEESRPSGSLADMILSYYQNREKLLTASEASRGLYAERLGPDAVARQLLELFRAGASL